MKLKFSGQIFENNQISQKSLERVPSFSVRTDRLTNITKLIVAFHNFAKAPPHPPKKKTSEPIQNNILFALSAFCLLLWRHTLNFQNNNVPKYNWGVNTIFCQQ